MRNLLLPILALLILSGCGHSVDESGMLPKPADVTSLSVWLPEMGEHTAFDVPKSHWNAILDAVRPIKRDPHPTRFFQTDKPVADLCAYHDNDGHHPPFNLRMFDTSGGPMACYLYDDFSGPYYLVGDAETFKKAIADAMKASK